MVFELTASQIIIAKDDDLGIVIIKETAPGTRSLKQYIVQSITKYGLSYDFAASFIENASETLAECEGILDRIPDDADTAGYADNLRKRIEWFRAHISDHGT